MSESQTAFTPTYADVFAKQLDEKHRLCIPAKWRFKGDEGENSYLAILTNYNAILVMPPDMAAELRSKISKISIANPQKRRALAKFMENACTFGCDKQGRIKLNDTILTKAQITKEACFAGMGGTFEIWNPKLREQWLGESSPEDDAALIEEFGI